MENNKNKNYQSEETPTNFGLVFDLMEHSEEFENVNEILVESEEINELRKIILDLNEPERQFITTNKPIDLQNTAIQLEFS